MYPKQITCNSSSTSSSIYEAAKVWWMHSGSSISPKHPAIPVSIGIASLVLEGRSSALDDSSVNASATGCSTSTAPVTDHGSGGGAGGGGGGSLAGSGAAGGDDDEDGGFCGRKRTSDGAVGGGASSLQQCSLMAINESKKSLAMACCHTTPHTATTTNDETRRINLKLQQIRSSCPGTSKDGMMVQQLVTVSGEPNRTYGTLEPTAPSSPSPPSSGSWFASHELSVSTGVVIYSGFEKMNVLGTVSPIKNHHHHSIGNNFINFSSPSSTSAVPSSSSASASSVQIRKPLAATNKQQPSSASRPREGPHCEQFLKKIGLTKPEATEGPEHCCSYRNKYCLRWQVYFKQLSSILTNGEAVCIEVYLGPENHTILLEQWILKLVMTKSPTATMTLQSLCAAIRSQLYFSQISAWIDLIKNSLEPYIFAHPRIKKIYPRVGGTSFPLPRAKLDILFRIRRYDSTACFNEQPNVHNFPDASVGENFAIQVCLKSLPRLDRIPGIDAALDAAKMSACLHQKQRIDRIPLPCHEKGKHRCAFRVELEQEEEEDEDDRSMVDGGGGGGCVGAGEAGEDRREDDDIAGDDNLLLTSAAISHREKQLLKYKKRMLKREKKKKAGGTAEGSSNGSSNSSDSRNGCSSTESTSYFSAKGSNSSSSSSSSTNKIPSGSFACSNAQNSMMAAAPRCSNDSCNSSSSNSRNTALTSSINSIQPPLYSLNDHRQQAMMICDDRFHTIATNTKSTQTVSGRLNGVGTLAVPPVVSVATQTDAKVVVVGSSATVCSDCTNRSQMQTAVSDQEVRCDQVQQPGIEASQNISPASSSSSTNRDKHMQYFNDYYKSYDIINENCDKGSAAASLAVDVGHQSGIDVPMEVGSSGSSSSNRSSCSTGVQKPRMLNTVPTTCVPPRPCFIVGGDGYEGDEDDDSEALKRDRSMANNVEALHSSKGQTDACRKQDGGYERSGNYMALNNNNYSTANNNFVEREVAENIRSSCSDELQRHHHHEAAACETSECDTYSNAKKLDLGDCRLCKRQKTKHNFKLDLTTLLSSALGSTATATAAAAATARKEAVKKSIITAGTVMDCGSTPPGCRRTLSESLVGHLTIPGVSSAASTLATNGGGAAAAGRRCDSGNENDRDSAANDDLSPGDSSMLSSSTGAVGNGIFTFEQMKSYRRAFSEDVIDTITTHGSHQPERSMLINRNHGRMRSTDEYSTEDDCSSGDNEAESPEFAQDCGCGIGGGSSGVERRPHRTSTPASTNGKTEESGQCKEPLYISCSETDCSVSTASSVSPHKKQILSCAAIGGNSHASRVSSEARCTTTQPSSGLKKQLTLYKSSPKINLNYVFCLSPLARDDSGFTSGSSPATSTSFPATSPIAIDGAGGGSGSAGGASGRKVAATGLFRYDFEDAPVSPVSSMGTIKSKSAPAFPFSSPPAPTSGALSPRFLRNAQRQFQHRSRYPSERSSFSERSSIGSDEQLSDDDLSSSYLLDSSSPLSSSCCYQQQLLPTAIRYPGRASATTLPMLSKVLNRNLFKFGRAPMLGTLEESLLQRRLEPKFQVADFKVLLGASGSFCPTQLTIPVASYFYELPGQHLTTPYVCELRLPRKGYSIPRSGTVQATLLNPLGTVVRMFVVPYDFRDMPAMSTTFIRQRILACDDSSLKLLGKNIEQLSNAEQMKLLRYAIHLRFQTSRSGKLSLHTDIRLLISRRTDCDTAAAHAKNLLESPNELKVVTIVPENPKFSLRIDKQQ
uniref:Atos-like conserved domain-containing protein n=1 Tax=Anopheles farauti TaxID=69004 RepID=A0A182Q0D8_9DIPT